MIRVTLYTRNPCELCDEVKENLEKLKAEIPHELVEVDIEADPALLKSYVEIIPVVKMGPYTLQAPITLTDLRVSLMAARDDERRASPATKAPSRRGVRLNQGLLFVSRHWLAMFNLFVLVYLGLPFSAPILMKLGAVKPAQVIYTIYSPLCHQLSFRSWFLFGEQAAYPLELAGTDLIPFDEATGLDGSDWQAARNFVGNEKVGYKMALCERDMAIYASIFIAGLAFIFLRERIKPLPIWLWVLIGILPIAVDGGSQLVLSLLGSAPRESTPFLRTLTGALFGISNVWLAYPYVEESMQETRALIAAKLAAAGKPI